MSAVIYDRAPLLMNQSFSRHSNSAGAPLPSIPRRNSQRSVPNVRAVFPPQDQSSPTRLVQSSPMSSNTLETDSKADIQTSSSSDSPLQFDTEWSKRHRNTRKTQLLAPGDSTPTPAFHEANVAAQSPNQTSFPVANVLDNETPRPLTNDIKVSHVNLDRQKSPSPLLTTKSEIIVPICSEDRRIRKRSGEPLKSSLKVKKPAPRGDLSIITGGEYPVSQSEPATPTHSRSKSVQFAAELERVKLFLAEQKPLAVSRDGSPTEDTSGTESEFPSFIYGKLEEERKNSIVVMEAVNMLKNRPTFADVMLEDVSLVDAVIQGHLQVRNLSYQKWIAVRFTFDWWQTTSEVSAKYEQSLQDGTFDRFRFSIRIHDMLPSIQEKTMFIAIRYSVNGREIWDNNGGQNYQLIFSVKSILPSSVNNSPDDLGVVDLKGRLARIARKVDPERSSPTYQRPFSHSKTTASLSPVDVFSFNSNTSLSSRYDFAASLKEPWKPAEQRSPSSSSHARMSTYPNSGTFPWPRKRGIATSGKAKKLQLTRGSPRIGDDYDPTMFTPIIQDQDVDVVEDDQISIDPVWRRRSHRGMSFDAGSSQVSGVKKTPHGSPIDIPGNVKSYYSFPSVLLPSPGIDCVIKESLASADGFSDSTPSVTSGSSDSQSVLSGSSSPESIALETLSDPEVESKKGSDLASFLDKFCFYTGQDGGLDDPTDVIHRSHSASSVEDILYSSPPLSSPPTAMQRSYTASRQSPLFSSSSYDDISGSLTPTPINTPRLDLETPRPFSISR